MSEQPTMYLSDVKYIIGSVMKYAYESIDDEKKEPTEFNAGRRLAYWEVLDTIYSRLDICEQNPKDFGYSENWEQEFWSK